VKGNRKQGCVCVGVGVGVGVGRGLVSQNPLG
jgi:hypothetical protein